MTNRDARLRNCAALLALISGMAQSASLWFLPTSASLLMTALCGSAFLLLALGLFGVSRFSLFLGVTLPALRAWFGLWPLPVDAAETLRLLADAGIAILCIPVLWSSLRPDYQHARHSMPSDAEEIEEESGA